MASGEPRLGAAGLSNELATNDEGAGVAKSPRRPRSVRPWRRSVVEHALPGAAVLYIVLHAKFWRRPAVQHAAGGVIGKRILAPWRTKMDERVYRRGSL